MTKEQLLKICPGAVKADLYAPLLDKYMKEYGITGRLRESAFIAQILHESGCFRYTEEIASGRAYEGRKDLGNDVPGYGIKYKGRCLIQITGYFNYVAISKSLKVDFVNHPEKLAEIPWCVEGACWWWVNHGLNVLADNGEFKTITRRINGGLNGYNDRVKYYKRALKVLS